MSWSRRAARSLALLLGTCAVLVALAPATGRARRARVLRPCRGRTGGLATRADRAVVQRGRRGDRRGRGPARPVGRRGARDQLVRGRRHDPRRAAEPRRGRLVHRHLGRGVLRRAPDPRRLPVPPRASGRWTSRRARSRRARRSSAILLRALGATLAIGGLVWVFACVVPGPPAAGPVGAGPGGHRGGRGRLGGRGGRARRRTPSTSSWPPRAGRVGLIADGCGARSVWSASWIPRAGQVELALAAATTVAVAAGGHAVSLPPVARSAGLTVAHVLAAVAWATALLWLERRSRTADPGAAPRDRRGRCHPGASARWPWWRCRGRCSWWTVWPSASCSDATYGRLALAEGGAAGGGPRAGGPQPLGDRSGARRRAARGRGGALCRARCASRWWSWRSRWWRGRSWRRSLRPMPPGPLRRVAVRAARGVRRRRGGADRRTRSAWHQRGARHRARRGRPVDGGCRRPDPGPDAPGAGRRSARPRDATDHDGPRRVVRRVPPGGHLDRRGHRAPVQVRGAPRRPSRSPSAGEPGRRLGPGRSGGCSWNRWTHRSRSSACRSTPGSSGW